MTRRHHLAAVVAAALLAMTAWAQATRGTITGYVRDSSGAVVPNVTVVVINQQTGFKTTVQSLADGAYLAVQLLPGDYTVAVEHPGFKQVSISNLKLDVASTLTQDVTLQLGATTETIRVTGQTSLVETTSAEVSTTVSISHVLEMPLVDRNVFNLINITPGAYFVSNNQSRAYINGSRGWDTASTVDGVSNMRGAMATQNMEIMPPVDSMQEFKVQASNYSAESGRSGGATVSGATKGGTNEFHGSFYEFLRNDKFDAAGWNADAKPPLRRNNYGGNIGGPIQKNKLFFFFNFDGLRNRSGGTVTRNVALPEWKTGNFSNAMRQVGNTGQMITIYDPETGGGTFTAPLNTSPFPGNIIPANRLDPVFLKVLAYMPAPNRAPNNPITQAGNWQYNRVNTNTRDFYIGRIDYEWNEKTKVFFRTMFTKPENVTRPYMPGWDVADVEGQVQRISHPNFALNVTRIINPTFFVSITGGWSRTTTPNYSGACCDRNFASELGIANAFLTDGFPSFNINGGLLPVNQLGAPNVLRAETSNTAEVSVNLTKMKGNHTLKFGGQYNAFQGNLVIKTSVAQYTFDGRFTRGVTATGAAIANTGINMADALLGRMTAMAGNLQPQSGDRIKYWAGYLQDDWRVTTNLTLNLGLRYEIETPMYEVANRMRNFDPYVVSPLAGTGDIPAGALGIVRFAGRDGNGKYLYNWDKNNISPRFGFAYRLRGSSTTLRGGYGIYYGTSMADAPLGFGSEPFTQSFSLAHPIPFRVRDGLPPNIFAGTPESEMTPTWGMRGTRFARSAINYLDPSRVFPYSQAFNLTLQHQYRGILFEAGYVGNLYRHVQLNAVNINRIHPDLFSRTDIPERLRRPYTVFASDVASINLAQANFGVENYHAFVAKIERRFANGIGWIVSFTHAKQIDNTTFVGGTQLGDNDQLQNIYNMRGERSASTANIGNRLVVSPIWDLPFGKGRPWLNRGGILNAVLGGWQVSTLGTFQSGFPFGVTVLNGPRDLLGDSAGGLALRPNLISNPNSPNKGQPAVGVRGIQWLDPNAFQVPARFTYGNASRTLPGVTGPGTVNFDAMLAKNFRVAERWRAQFRWEAFNMFNTPTFGLPAQDLGGANFGIVTNAGGRRIMQFALKLYW